MCAETSTASRRCATDPRRRQHGLSIIELMVGMVVALLVGLAAAGSAIMFTASQRQGIGVGGVSLNAAAALSAIKEDAASAGLGFFGEAAYLCQAMNFSNGATMLIDGAAFVPVRITEDGTDDRLDVVYASSIAAGANVLLNAASDGSSAELMSYLPAAVGEAVLLAPDELIVGAPACMVRTVTAVTPSSDTTPQLLSFGAAGAHNQLAFSTPPAYPPESRATLLGTLSWSRYRRIGTDLVFERPIAGDSAVLARNVMALRMQYGVSPAVGATTLEDWVDANGADFGNLGAAALPRVRAVRIGVVTRSPQREKPDAGGNCESTLVMPQLFGEDIVPDVADWQCFRYRVATVVVPLRNIVYGVPPP